MHLASGSSQQQGLLIATWSTGYHICLADGIAESAAKFCMCLDGDLLAVFAGRVLPFDLEAAGDLAPFQAAGVTTTNPWATLT
jgi:hypothetical protein